MRTKLMRLIIFLMLLGFGSLSHAISLNYSIIGTGSGSLGGVSFSNTAFSIDLIGDTDLFNGVSIDPLSSATVSISGFDTTTLNIATRLGSTPSVAFFSRASSAGSLDLFDFNLSGPVDLTQAFGPVVGTGVFALNQFSNVASSLGLLTFLSSSDVSFQAVNVSTVPVPAAAWLFGSAVLGFFGMRRKSAKITALTA